MASRTAGARVGMLVVVDFRFCVVGVGRFFGFFGRALLVFVV